MPSKDIPLTRCTKCGKFFIPVKYSCTECGNKELESVNVDSKTSIYSYTVIRVPPDIYKDQAPYYIALVKFDDIPGNLLVTARVSAPEGAEMAIGKEVLFTGVNELGYGFELI